MYKINSIILVLLLYSYTVSNVLAACDSKPPTKENVVELLGAAVDCKDYLPRYPVQPDKWVEIPKRGSDNVCFSQASASFNESDTIESLRIITEADLNALLRKIMPEKSFRQLWEARNVTRGPGEVKTYRFTYVRSLPVFGKDVEWHETYKDECLELRIESPNQLARALFTSVAAIKWN